MAASDSFDRTSRLTTIGIFVAMVVDGMDLQMLAVALPSISSDLKISSVMAGALSTYTLLGMGLGGILAGWLSDRVGRVRVVWWSVLVFTVCTTVIAFTPGYWQIAFIRFVSGFGISGLYSVGTLLAYRMRSDTHPNDGARRASGRVVGGLRDCGAAGRVSPAASGVEAALLLLDPAGQHRAAAPVEHAGPAERVGHSGSVKGEVGVAEVDQRDLGRRRRYSGP